MNLRSCYLVEINIIKSKYENYHSLLTFRDTLTLPDKIKGELKLSTYLDTCIKYSKRNKQFKDCKLF